MLRAWNFSLRTADSPTSRRRRHRFVPSVGGTAAALEDRALLSAIGGLAAVGDIASPSRPHAPVKTHHGHVRVTRHHLTLPDGAPAAAHAAATQSVPPNASGSSGSSNPFTGSTPPPNGSVGPVVADSAAAGADVASPVRANPPHAPVGSLPGQGKVPRSKLTRPDNGSVGPVVA